MQHLRNVDDHAHDKVCRFEPADGDFCYVRINPNENVWEKGLVIRKVICVPDSYVVEVDGHRNHRNKCDLTLVPPSDDNGDKSESDDHQSDHDVPMARALMPTLHPRPHLKFPKLPYRLHKRKISNCNVMCMYCASISNIQIHSASIEICHITTCCHPISYKS